MRILFLYFSLASSVAMAHCSYEVMNNAIRDNDLELLEKCAAETPLSKLPDRGPWSPFHEAALHDNVAAAKILLNHGANIDVMEGNGWTPLHVSVLKRHFEMTRFLVSKGASSSIVDANDHIPIDYVPPTNTLLLAAVLGACPIK